MVRKPEGNESAADAVKSKHKAINTHRHLVNGNLTLMPRSPEASCVGNSKYVLIVICTFKVENIDKDTKKSLPTD
jgi:hypothetical protein